MKHSVLVTGGAGYIGSHLVKHIGTQGHIPSDKLLVLDDLSTGFKQAVCHGRLIEACASNNRLVYQILKESAVETVLHFAAKTIVPESVSNPLKYYRCNTLATLQLIQACVEAGVKNFIFSSTAAVYGLPSEPECTEDTLTQPINAYGMSKLMSETILKEACRAHGLKYVILRYFNVAGCDPTGTIGQSTRHATLLIKVAVEAALGKRECVYVYGTDYPTPDGTGVRDYIHVADLADAHVCAMDYLNQGGESTTLNCGYGHGFSVKEVLSTLENIHGSPLTIRYEARRAGDPPSLIANTHKIRQTLDWQPQYDDLSQIISSALHWEKKLPRYD